MSAGSSPDGLHPTRAEVIRATYLHILGLEAITGEAMHCRCSTGTPVSRSGWGVIHDQRTRP
ncbi:hypothetical protein ABZV58_15070 [Nocardia sp. NPDC004654]|uniref:hypothetical protein n=1 Tax=Nocardia sp. NPDC004654 TaxID=3154776 RepID=UPI0033A29F85